MSTRQPIPVRPQFPPAGDSLVKAAFAAWTAAARGGTAQEAVRRLFGDDQVAELLLVAKAATAPAMTSVPGWAAELAQQASGAFLAGLVPEAAAATLIARGVRVDLERGRVREMRIPSRPAGPIARGFVDEAAEIPVTQFALDDVLLGPAGKLAVIVVMSRELARRSAAEKVFTQALREDAALSLDTAYFSEDAATTEHPAGLLNGVTPITPATVGAGSVADTAGEDLAALAAAVGAGGSGEVLYIAGPGRAATLRVYLGNRATVLASLAVAEDVLIGIDPLSIVHGVGPDPDIIASAESTLHMDDAPAPIGTPGSPNTIAAPTVSMFQTGNIALRLIVDVAFVKRRANAVAFIDGITAW